MQCLLNPSRSKVNPPASSLKSAPLAEYIEVLRDPSVGSIAVRSTWLSAYAAENNILGDSEHVVGMTCLTSSARQGRLSDIHVLIQIVFRGSTHIAIHLCVYSTYPNTAKSDGGTGEIGENRQSVIPLPSQP
jgi:hypothetical protein